MRSNQWCKKHKFNCCAPSCLWRLWVGEAAHLGGGDLVGVGLCTTQGEGVAYSDVADQSGEGQTYAKVGWGRKELSHFVAVRLLAFVGSLVSAWLVSYEGSVVFKAVRNVE